LKNLESALRETFPSFNIKRYERSDKFDLPVSSIRSLLNMETSVKMESDIEFIPTNTYFDVRKLIEGGFNVWVEGPAGCSKSRPIKEAALNLGFGYYRINMNGHSTDEALLGSPRMQPDDETKAPIMYWLTGIMEKAATHGLNEKGEVVGMPAVLHIDEIDAAPPETHFVLQSVLEPDKTFVIDGDGSRLVKAHPKFVIVAAANTKGSGDFRGGYVGTNPMNISTRDRFHFMLSTDFDAKLEDTILSKLVPHGFKGKIGDIKKFILMVRKANLDGSISFVMSVRRVMALARGIDVFGGSLGKSYFMSIANFVEPDQQNAVNELFQRAFGLHPSKA